MTTRRTLHRTAVGLALLGLLSLTGCGTDLPSGFVDDGVQTLPPTDPAEPVADFTDTTVTAEAYETE